MAKFKVSITGKDEIWKIEFLLNKDKKNKVQFSFNFARTEWESKAFEYTGQQLIYKLKVYALWGTGWEGKIIRLDSGEEVEFLKWKESETSQKNESNRTRPLKSIS